MKKNEHLRKQSTQFDKLVKKFKWAMAINSIQRILTKRCKEPLLDLFNEYCHYYQPNNIYRVIKKHTRHLSDGIDDSMEAVKLLELLKHRRTPTDSQHKSFNEQTKLFSHRNRDDSISFFAQEEQAKVNEEFLALFQENKDQSLFGKLTPKTKIEQDQLVKQLQSKKTIKNEINDINTFIELIKKPKINIEQTLIEQESEFHYQFILFCTIVIVFIILLI